MGLLKELKEFEGLNHVYFAGNDLSRLSAWVSMDMGSHVDSGKVIKILSNYGIDYLLYYDIDFLEKIFWNPMPIYIANNGNYIVDAKIDEDDIYYYIASNFFKEVASHAADTEHESALAYTSIGSSRGIDYYHHDKNEFDKIRIYVGEPKESIINAVDCVLDMPASINSSDISVSISVSWIKAKQEMSTVSKKISGEI